MSDFTLLQLSWMAFILSKSSSVIFVFLQVLLGTPDYVSADIEGQRAGATVDDYFHVVLHYPNGRRGVTPRSRLFTSCLFFSYLPRCCHVPLQQTVCLAHPHPLSSVWRPIPARMAWPWEHFELRGQSK